jgi:tetratricopeptide (TPR) repeat protein
VRRRRSAVLPAVVLAAVCLWRFQDARDQLRASLELGRVQGETQAMLAAGRVYPQRLRRSVDRLRDARELAPAEAALPLAEGSLHLLGRHPRAAVKAYEDALALEPRPETWLNLGRAQLAAGDREDAVESFRKAATLNPHFRRQIPPDVRAEMRSGS